MDGLQPFSRRRFMLLGLAATLGGCVSPIIEEGGPGGLIPLGGAKQPETPVKHPAAPSIKPPDFRYSTVAVLDRGSWARAAPISSRLNPMRGISRITVHHSADVFWSTNFHTSAAELERIRRQHLSRMHAGDIGYHFIIDRAGRIWQGRPAAYQGAHVKNNNPHNLGICVLGNFEKQRPGFRQKRQLHVLLNSLIRTLRVSSGKVRTHREITGKTLCPGRHLQKYVASLRVTL